MLHLPASRSFQRKPMHILPLTLVIATVLLIGVSGASFCGEGQGGLLAEAMFSAPTEGVPVTDPEIVLSAGNWDGRLLVNFDPDSSTRSSPVGLSHRGVDVLVRTYGIDGREVLVKNCRFGWLCEFIIPGLKDMNPPQVSTVAQEHGVRVLGAIEGMDKIIPMGKEGEIRFFRTATSLPSEIGAKGAALVLQSGDRLGIFLAKTWPIGGPAIPASSHFDLSLAGNAGWFSLPKSEQKSNLPLPPADP